MKKSYSLFALMLSSIVHGSFSPRPLSPSSPSVYNRLKPEASFYEKSSLLPVKNNKIQKLCVAVMQAQMQQDLITSQSGMTYAQVDRTVKNIQRDRNAIQKNIIELHQEDENLEKIKSQFKDNNQVFDKKVSKNLWSRYCSCLYLRSNWRVSDDACQELSGIIQYGKDEYVKQTGFDFPEKV